MGDDYWNRRRKEIIDAYDNPFGAVGAPLPGRAVARTRLDVCLVAIGALTALTAQPRWLRNQSHRRQ